MYKIYGPYDFIATQFLALTHQNMVQLAREQAEKAAAQESYSEMGTLSNVLPAASGSSVELPPVVVSVSVSSSAVSAVASSPVSVTPVTAVASPPASVVSGSPAAPTVQLPAAGVLTSSSLGETISPPSVMPGSLGVPSLGNSPLPAESSSVVGSSMQNIEVLLVSIIVFKGLCFATVCYDILLIRATDPLSLFKFIDFIIDVGCGVPLRSQIILELFRFFLPKWPEFYW